MESGSQCYFSQLHYSGGAQIVLDTGYGASGLGTLVFCVMSASINLAIYFLLFCGHGPSIWEWVVFMWGGEPRGMALISIIQRFFAGGGGVLFFGGRGGLGAWL